MIEANSMELAWDSIGHAYVHPWVDSKIPVTPEFSWDGTEPWGWHPDITEEENLL